MHTLVSEVHPACRQWLKAPHWRAVTTFLHQYVAPWVHPFWMEILPDRAGKGEKRASLSNLNCAEVRRAQILNKESSVLSPPHHLHCAANGFSRFLGLLEGTSRPEAPLS